MKPAVSVRVRSITLAFRYADSDGRVRTFTRTGKNLDAATVGGLLRDINAIINRKPRRRTGGSK